MKKIFVAVAVVALFASCKKDYTCNYPDPTPDVSYNGLSKTQADLQATACTLGGGTWNKN